MTEPTMVLMEMLRKRQVEIDGDFLRDAVQPMKQMLIELEASERVSAGRYERTPEQATRHNGYRRRIWDARVGEIQLHIPNCGKGATSPIC